tara:strand:- start:12 stop:182 length:171 start_codon:yes stop_codon:yes gene_type:complete
MAKYKLENTVVNGRTIESVRDKESTPTISIPKDTANADYAEYLEWVAAGNTAEAAD